MSLMEPENFARHDQKFEFKEGNMAIFRPTPRKWTLEAAYFQKLFCFLWKQVEPMCLHMSDLYERHEFHVYGPQQLLILYIDKIFVEI